MNKQEKKIARVQEQIQRLEEQLQNSLGKKTHDTPEISLSEYQRKRIALTVQLKELTK